MQSPEVFRLLTRKIHRGAIGSRILSIVSMICACVAIPFPGGLPWAIAAFFVSLLFVVLWVHVRGRGLEAFKVSENPKLVYWAHPTGSSDGLVSIEAVERCTLLTLHLRDGSHFQARLSRDEMDRFILWLKERNPSIRWGFYDSKVSPSAGLA